MKYGIIIILVNMIVPIAFALMRNKRDDNQKDVFYYPRSFFVIAFISYALLTVIYVALFVSGQIADMTPLFMYVVLFPATSFLIFGGTYLLLKAINFRLELKRDVIVYRNIFRKTYIINYSDVLEVISWYFPDNKKKMQEHKIITKTKKITIEYMTINYALFFQTLKNRLRKNNVQCKFTIKKGNLKY